MNRKRGGAKGRIADVCDGQASTVTDDDTSRRRKKSWIGEDTGCVCEMRRSPGVEEPILASATSLKREVMQGCMKWRLIPWLHWRWRRVVARVDHTRRRHGLVHHARRSDVGGCGPRMPELGARQEGAHA